MSLLKGLGIRGRIRYNEPLCRHTSFRIGGPAKVWAAPKTAGDLADILEFSKAQGLPAVLIGEGSNLLVRDGELAITAVSLMEGFDYIKVSGPRICCGAGRGLQKFVLEALRLGYAGLEFMAGIPGSVGGALRMNAGAGKGGPWLSDFVERVAVMDYDAKVRYFDKDELGFGYRRSGLNDFVILEAEFNLSQGADKAALLGAYKKFLADKKNRQELFLPSAGCVFKNPADSDFSAAQLIEGCGLKGARIGGAAVSEKHANFIVNLNKATFLDVIELIELIKDKVLKAYNIHLETEIEILK